MDQKNLFVAGRWTRSDHTQDVEILNPATAAPVGRAALAGAGDVDAAVEGARRSFESGVWANTPPADRADVLDRAADVLERRAEELALTMTAELGCPLWFSRAAHVPNPIRHLRANAEHTRTWSFDEHRGDGTVTSLVTQEPVGVVGAITAWNGPLSSPVIKVAPALGAGCSVVLKPAAETPFTVMALAEALEEAGLPEGVLSIVPGDRDAGAHLVAHPEVDKVAFTGSTAAGRKIMAACADRIGRLTLELGGKSAAIVLDDADVDEVVAKVLPMAMAVNGQLCIAQTRVLVPRRLQSAFVEALGAAMAAQVVGDPLADETKIGPLISRQQLGRVTGYIDAGRAEGAKVAVGGGLPSMPGELAAGWFVEPTLFYDVDNSMRVAREEIFGPVMAVIPFDDEDDAVAIANDSPYGLSGSVWSADRDRATAIARRVRTGMVSVNGAPQAFGTPFGGFKQSGVGREMGPEGFAAYLETKSIALGAL